MGHWVTAVIALDAVVSRSAEKKREGGDEKKKRKRKIFGEEGPKINVNIKLKNIKKQAFIFHKNLNYILYKPEHLGDCLGGAISVAISGPEQLRTRNTSG